MEELERKTSALAEGDGGRMHTAAHRRDGKLGAGLCRCAAVRPAHRAHRLAARQRDGGAGCARCAALVDTVNGLTGELEKAQLADTLDSLRTISAQLEKVDWAALEQSTGDMLAQAQKSLAAAEEALTAVNDAAEKLDVEGLNTAVTELLAVMQPLAEFFARFK